MDQTTDPKVAFVTGAASGIGRAAAEAFTRRGWATALADMNEEAGRAAAAELGELGKCAFVACDVTDDDTVRDAVATLPGEEREVVERRFGLDGGDSRTVSVVADELARPTVWVRRTERRALRRLRSHPAVLALKADGR